MIAELKERESVARAKRSGKSKKGPVFGDGMRFSIDALIKLALNSVKKILAYWKSVVAVALLIGIGYGAFFLYDIYRPTQLRNQGLSNFEDGEYEEAIFKMSEYLNLRPKDLEIVHFRAVAHLETGHFREARKDFLTLETSDESEQIDRDTDYYFYNGILQYPNIRNALPNFARALDANQQHVPSLFAQMLYRVRSADEEITENDKIKVSETLRQLDAADFEDYAASLDTLYRFLLFDDVGLRRFFEPRRIPLPQDFDLGERVIEGYDSSYYIGLNEFYDPENPISSEMIADLLAVIVDIEYELYSDASERLDSMLSNPNFTNSPEVHTLKGIVESLTNEPSKALRDFSSAKRLAENSVGARVNHAHATMANALSIDEFADVSVEMDAALEIDNEDPRLYNNRGFLDAWGADRLYNKARNDFNRAIKLRTEYIPAYYNLGHIDMAVGEYDEAIKFFTRVQDDNPKFGAALFHRGEANRLYGNVENALEDYAEYKKVDAKSAAPFEASGLLLIDNRQYVPAIDELEVAYTLDPQNFEVTRLLIETLSRIGRNRRAESLLSEVERQNPQNAEVLLLRGRVLLARNDPGASAVLRRAYDSIKDPSEKVNAAIFYSRALNQDQDYQSALDITREILPQDPENDDLLLIRASALLGVGKIDESTALVQRVLDKDSNNYEARMTLGRVYVSSRSYFQGLGEFREAFSLRPNSTEALEEIAAVQRLLGNEEGAMATEETLSRITRENVFQEELSDRAAREKEEQEEDTAALVDPLTETAQTERLRTAIQQYSDQLEKDGPNSAVFHARGIYYLALGENDDAIEDFRSALELEPTNVTVASNLGLSLMRKRDYQGAIEVFTGAIESAPSNFEVLYNRAVAFTNLENFENAIADFDQALQLRPDFPEAYFQKGRLFMKMERYPSAIRDLSRAIELRPNYAQAYIARSAAYQLIGEPIKAKEDAKTARVLRASKSQ